MLASGSLLGGRFRVLRNFGQSAEAIALARDSNDGQECWLVQIAVTASEAQLAESLERHGRFAVGISGLARPIATGTDGGSAFVAFRAPASGNVADGLVAAWSAERVAALAMRIAGALGPLHEQGIAYGYLLPELVAESESGEVLFGFGVAALATAFGAAGEASQLLPPPYRAPELRAALLAPTPASDVFAFAVLLRALLSGARPTSQHEPDAEATRVALLPQIEALLARAESADPRLRPRDVRAFAAEFAECARVLASDATPSALSAPSAPVPESLSDVAPIASPFVAAPPPAVLLLRAAVLAPPEPQRAQSSARSAFLALFVVFTGLLLMVGGVVGAFVYASRHMTALAKVVGVPTAVSAPHHPAPIPAPAPTEDDEPPLATPAPEPELAPDVAPAPRAHAPLVAPGVGPSSFPDEARVALPVLGSEPIWGTRKAPLTWTIFGDLDCPHTRRLWRALEAVKASFGDDLRIVFRHRPLREHPNALRAARVMAGLAKQRGARAFFDVLRRVAQDEVSLSDEHLTAVLAAAGHSDLKLLDLAREGEPIVASDLQLAGQFALKSTPFSFLNGLPIDGERTVLELDQLLLAEQRSATWASAAGVPPAALYATRTSSNLIGVGNSGDARVCVPVASSAARGPADAPVTIVEFADFECQFCKRVEPTLKTLLARYPRTLRQVWKDYPLPQHKGARLLANFAADAKWRGSNAGFWSVHDGLFAESEAIDDNVLGALAGKAGLDGALLLISAHAGTHDAAIHADIALGQRLGVNGTPTFFVNGRRVQGAVPLEQFDALIQEELKTAQRIVLHGVPARDVYGLACD